MSADAMTPVYVALVEVTPLDGCWLDAGNFAGACVRCYVAAKTDVEAMELITATLQENQFQLVDLEWCVDESAVEWEKPDDATAAALISEARTSKTVVFGEFHTWPAE